MTNDYCAICNGSGEGQYDGAICPSCKGCGIEVDQTEKRELEQEHIEHKTEDKYDN